MRAERSLKALARRRTERVDETLRVARTVVTQAVDEEARGSVHPTAHAAEKVALDLGVVLSGEGGGDQGGIDPRRSP